jgi:hypothetical protein
MVSRSGPTTTKQRPARLMRNTGPTASQARVRNAAGSRLYAKAWPMKGRELGARGGRRVPVGHAGSSSRNTTFTRQANRTIAAAQCANSRSISSVISVSAGSRLCAAWQHDFDAKNSFVSRAGFSHSQQAGGGGGGGGGGAICQCATWE